MLRFLLFMLMAAGVNAGQVVVNDNNCGALVSAALDAQGNIAIQSTQACGAGVPPPPPPHEDPFVCVPSSMLNCIERPFPVIMQEIVSLYGSKTVAIKVRVPASGRGYISTMVYAGVTAARTVTLSTLPGEMTAPRECVKAGFEVTGNAWTTTPGVRGECLLPPGKDVYINIQASNCPAGARCKIYLKAN